MFDTVIDQVLAALAVAAAGLIVAILKKLLDKLGLALSAEREAQLESVVADGIARAKEIAAVRLKAYGQAIPAAQKLEIAKEHVLDTLKQVSPEKVDAKIESTLAKVGEGATVPKA